MTETENKKPYWRLYHYNNDPFMLDNAGEYFISDTWNEYLDLLPQFLRYCNSLVIIDGQDGVGKTSLVKQFITENNGDANIVIIDAKEITSVTDLLQLIHEKFSAPYDPESSADTSDQIEAQLNELKLNKSPRMLIIDNAENLPLDVRQACLQITQQQTNLETCLPIILVGTERVGEHFKALLTPTTAQTSLHFLHLVSFNLEDTEDYLQWCLEQVGEQKDESPFSDEDIETIFTASQGIVGKINQSARNMLQVKLEQQDTRSGLRKKLLWWGLTLIVIIIVLFIYKQLSKPPELTTTFTKPIALRQPPSTQAPISSSTPTEKATQQKPKDTQIGNMLIHSEKESSKKQPVVKQHIEAHKKTTTTTQPKAPIVPAKKPLVIHATPKTKAKTTTNKNDLFHQVMTDKLAIEHKRVKGISGKNYTLQLMAAQNLHAIEQFIVRHQLQSTAMTVKITRNNKTWYVVLYGIFANRSEAIANLKQINPQLQKLKPWPRSYASIHQAMQ